MRRVLAATLACLILGGAIAPAVAVGSPTPTTEAATIAPGAKLTGVVGVQEAEVDGTVRERAFQIAFSNAESNESKAATVATTVRTLGERLDRLEQRRSALQAARSNGSLSTDQFTARMAIIGAEIETIRRLANRTAAANRALPDAAVRAAGLDRDSIPALKRRATNMRTPEVVAASQAVAGRQAGRPLGNVTGPPGNAGAPAVPGRNETGQTTGPPKNTNDRSQANKSQGANARSIELYSAGETERALQPTADAARGNLLGRESSRRSLLGPSGYTSQDLPGSDSARRAAIASQDEQRPLFKVDVTETGDARVTLQLAFDLTTDADREAFNTLKEDTSAQRDVSTRFRDRLQSIANSSEQRVERSMAVHDPAINMTTSADGTTGFVAISVGWDGLAGLASDPAHLVLTEPFASGFTPSRQFTVRITAPDRFRVTSIRPAPETQDNASATWAAGTTLNGFQLVFSPGTSTPLPDEMIEEFEPSSPSGGTPASAGPSSSALIVGGALLVGSGIGAWLLWRRRQAEQAADSPEEG